MIIGYRIAVLAALLVLIGLEIRTNGLVAHLPAVPVVTAAPAPPAPVDLAQQIEKTLSAKPEMVDPIIRAWPIAHPDDMQKAVKVAIMADPAMLQEAYGALQQRQQAAQMAKAKEQIAARHDDLFAKSGDPVVGPAGPGGEGVVTLVEFFDYECPFCKRVAPELEKLVANDPKVRVVYKEFPILGPVSVIAAKAALAAQAQGKYEPFHNALLADATKEHELTEAHIIEIAKNAGVDLDRLKADVANPDLDLRINANRQLAQALGITGTPGLIVGDSLAPGALPYDRLAQMVAQQRTTSQSTQRAAVP